MFGYTWDASIIIPCIFKVQRTTLGKGWKECKGQRKRRNGVKFYPLDKIWLLHKITHISHAYLFKPFTRLKHKISRMERGGFFRFYSSLRSYWNLMTVGRRIIFLYASVYDPTTHMCMSTTLSGLSWLKISWVIEN